MDHRAFANALLPKAPKEDLWTGKGIIYMDTKVGSGGGHEGHGKCACFSTSKVGLGFQLGFSQFISLKDGSLCCSCKV